MGVWPQVGRILQASELNQLRHEPNGQIWHLGHELLVHRAKLALTEQDNRYFDLMRVQPVDYTLQPA
ncbi:hypothetical protein G6F46_014463 [Rhizopus delemar]|nr:hypothetical protein G6F46_014463 [Rhizopus delemar]